MSQSTTIYGIKNCDTMKKALKWLEDNKVPHTFHDYKKAGTDEKILRAAIDQCGWDNVINRRGTTWRQLPEGIKNAMEIESAIKVAQENPSIIKRPLPVRKNNIYLGFKNETYQQFFSGGR